MVESPTPEHSDDTDSPDTSTKPAEHEALDHLFQRSRQLRQSAHYRRFLDFIARLSNYSPFNGAILHVQRPGAQYFATQSQWHDRFGRTVKAEARPCVILQPFGPILFVFAADDTLPGPGGEPLPEQITDPFAVEGDLSPTTWRHTITHCEEDERVKVQFSRALASGFAGFIARNGTGFTASPAYTHVVTLRGRDTTLLGARPGEVSAPEQYAAFAHEMGHLFCGHLGRGEGDWWPDRRDLSRAQREIEAESVAYLVCRRAGLHSLSERYLHGHVLMADACSAPAHAASPHGSSPSGEADAGLLPPLGIETILKAVTYIEKMGTAGFTSKRGTK